MGHAQSLRASASLMRLAASALLIAAVGCRSPSVSLSDSETLPDDEVLLAHSWPLTFLIEPLGNGLVVRSENGAVECANSVGIIQAWRTIQELTLDCEPDHTSELSLDPNLETHGAVVGLANILESGQFEIRQVTGEVSMETAAGSINTILSECGVEETFRLTIIRSPQK